MYYTAYRWQVLALLVALCSLVSLRSYAQDRNYTLMFADDSWQRIDANPAYMPNKGSMLFALPSLTADIKLPFINKNSLKVVDGQATVFLDRMLADFGASPSRSDMNLNFFAFGMKIQDFYLSAGLSLRGLLHSSVHKDLMNLLARGNGQFMNKVVSGQGLWLTSEAWGELSLGLAYKFSDKFSLGARVKYLSGLASVNTLRSKTYIQTSKQGEELLIKTNKHYILNLPFKISADENQRLDLLDEDADRLKLRDNLIRSEGFHYNPFEHFGFGLDLGAEYRFNKSWLLALNVQNLSFIRWGASSSQSVRLDVESRDPISMKGANINEVLKNEFEGARKNPLESMIEVVERNSKISEGEEHYSFQPTYYSFTAGYSYGSWLKAYSTVGLVDRHQGKLGYELAVSTYMKALSWLSTAVSLSKNSHQDLNLGLALIFGDKVQGFIATDNMLALIPSKFLMNVHLGLNLHF